MQINILNGNVAGAKFLEETDQKKKTEFRESLNERLRCLAKEHAALVAHFVITLSISLL